MASKWNGPPRAALATFLVLTLPAKIHAAPEVEGRKKAGPFAVVLGIAQDGGYPQAGCAKACCARAWKSARERRHVAALAVVDPAAGKRWLIDATPDFREQLRLLDETAPVGRPGVDGIFLTHAHVGHYAGLIHLGREVIGAKRVPLHAMPRMAEFLRTSGPWAQLVRLGNVEIQTLEDGKAVALGGGVRVTPVRVPHRDEYSETVAFRVQGPNRSILYLPDIDRWEKWDRKLDEVVRGKDLLLVDGTFFSGDELPGRDLREIPHPTIRETMDRLQQLAGTERRKVRFIHLNHTNPALDPGSAASREILKQGFSVAVQGERIPL
jgi:pyrroloquinoline quinone biosynthesis protein B